jgi:hypothetical protein
MRSLDILAESISNLAKARKVDGGHKERHISITHHHRETQRINVKMEEIQLVQKQLNTMKE